MNGQHIVKSTRDHLLEIAWQLPYETRRAAFQQIFPKRFDALQQMRHRPTQADYGLASFDKHECIFVHVPKCAGVSVSRSLFGSLVGTHVALKTFQLIYSKDEFARYFKFAFVRNPWDRLVSAYRFLKRGGMTNEDRAWAKQHIAPYENFDTFVKAWVTPRNVNSWQHFKPQHRFLLDPTGRCHLDYLGRFENLEDDFEQIAQQLGIDARIAHLNRTKSAARKRDYRSYYSEETSQIVATVYRKDIEVFGYEFDSAGPVSMRNLQPAKAG